MSHKQFYFPRASAHADMKARAEKTTDWKALADKLAKALGELADAADYKLDVEMPYFEAQTVLVEYRAAIAKEEIP